MMPTNYMPIAIGDNLAKVHGSILEQELGVWLETNG